MASPNLPILASRYLLHEKLGQGGMGSVYRCTDRLSGETVALKRIDAPMDELRFKSRPAAAFAQALPLALAGEFQTLASLRHPNIISVLDYGFDENRRPYFTMQYLNQARNIVAVGRELPIQGAARLLVQALEALTYLHRRGILHRDLKPENILATPDGRGSLRVQLLDFGLSIDRAAAAERAGTLDYMAPEMLQHGQAGEASDLYAMGVIAYEIFAGRRPFEANNVLAQLYQGVDLSPFDDQPALALVIGKLLRKNPQTRSHDAAQVIPALLEAVHLPLPVEDLAVRESFLQAAQFIGREAELGQLVDALNQAAQGKGSAWLVGGESGVGKSRLLDELRIRSLVNGAHVLRGQALESSGLPYELWRDPLRRLALAAPLTDLQAGVFKALIPDLPALLGRAVPDPPPLNEGEARQRLVIAMLEFLQSAARQAPLVLLLEDLHWAVESLQPLALLSRECTDLPLLIVASYRDDERPGLPAELPAMRPLPLKRLQHEQISRLSASMLGESGARPEVVTLLQRETEGNVFFLVETVRALAEAAGRLEDIGRATLPAAIFAGGVRQVIQRRLDHIPPAARPLLKLAAVAGRALDMNLLHKLEPRADLENWLAAAGSVAVLEAYEGGWRFAHDRLRQALLAEMDETERRRLHLQAAGALENLYAADPSFAPALFEHFFAAGETARAAHYARRAGVFYARQYAVQEAVRLFSQALALTPESDLRGRYALLLERERLHMLTGETAARREDLQTLEEIGAALHDEACRAEIALRQAGLHLLSGDHPAVAAAAQTAIAAAQATQLPLLEARAYLELARSHIRNGEYPQAYTSAGRCLTLARSQGDQRLEADALRLLGSWAGMTGDAAACRMHYEQALHLFRQAGDRLGESASLNNLGIIQSAEDEFEAAQQSYEQALALKRQIGHRSGEVSVLSNLGDLLIQRGRYSQALLPLEEALQLAGQINLEDARREALMLVGVIYLEMGAYELAQEKIAGCLHIGQSKPEHQVECLASLHLGIAYHEAGDFQTGYEHLQRALHVAEATDNPSLLVPTLVALGNWLVDQKQPDAAETAYRQALQRRAATHLPLPMLVGLVRVAQARQESAQAMEHVNQALDNLPKHLPPEANRPPLWIYLECYKVLRANGDERARPLLDQALARLYARAAQINNPDLRCSFLERVPYHWALLQAEGK